MLSTLFHTILFQPIFNIFVGLYNVIPGHDTGIVILIITILVRLAVYPLTSSSIKAQKSMQEVQPKMEEIKKKYKNDQQGQAAAMMKMYKENKVNPFSSCLPILIQLPILIALYMVLRKVLASDNMAENLYSFISNPETIKPIAFGFLELAKPSVALALLAGGAQYLQAKNMMDRKAPAGAGAGAKDENMTAMMNKQMKYMMPILTVVIGVTLPAGLTLYWFLSTGLTWAQQLFLGREKKSETEVVSDKNENKVLDSSDVIEGEVEDK